MLTGLLVHCQGHGDCHTIERTKGKTIDEIIKSFNVDKNARDYVIEFLDEDGDYLGYYDPVLNYLNIQWRVIEQGLVENPDEYIIDAWGDE
jgi:hypothetical protein